MSISAKDYTKLYHLQDRILLSLKPVLGSFYLTGGTALGRYYLNHRYSEDLDFFINSKETFGAVVKNIEKVLSNKFQLLRDQSIIYEDYVRYYIEDERMTLKIEFVNDIAYRCGLPNVYPYGFIDTPLNILTNKLTAIVSRDEPKDVFDICCLARNYKFNWLYVFGETRKKAIINEIEVEQRIKSFPVQILQKKDWHISLPDLDNINIALQVIADDFLLGSDNSLGTDKPSIEKAKLQHFDLK